MDAILESKCRELHRDQPVEIHDPVAVEHLGGRELGSGGRIRGLDGLASKENPLRLAGLALGAVREGVDPERVLVHKARGFERRDRPRQIHAVKRLGLETTVRPRGRPRKCEKGS